MKKFKIFAEGNDCKFLHDYIEYLFHTTLEWEKDKKSNQFFVNTGGWTTLTNEKNKGEELRQAMKRNIDEDGINLIIFDADKDFQRRQEEINKWKKEYSLDFELFLFPNNKDSGALEDLLEKIINLQNAPIFECWKSFEECLEKKTTCVRSPLTIPAKKSKIYAYMETLHGETNKEKEKVKDRNRDYKDKKCWDLDAETLNPLKKFLERHLSE